MLAQLAADWRRRAEGPLAGAALPWLGGCAESSPGAGPWLFATVALLVAAVAAFAWGRLAERASSRRELRDARAAQRSAEQMQDGWAWRTDAQHRLTSWQAPGQAPALQCGLFAAGAAPAALADKLQARQAFAGLRLHSATPFEGSHGWQLRGVPHHDDLGAFCGFAGRAEPTDSHDALQAAAAAVPALLAACAGPALVAHERGAAWQVQGTNAAAQLLWPMLKPGVPLADALHSAPAAVSQAWAQVQPGDVIELQGWRLAGFGPLPGTRRAVLITRPAAPGPEVETAEGDNFSFTVTHDLRAPIRVVEGFTRIVKEDYGRLLDRVGNDHLDRVLSAAARMNLMIDALLTLARLSSQPLARQPVDLSQLASYVVDDLRRSAPERLADIEVQPGLTAHGDPTLLRLVLENLLGNAWKYSARCPKAQISLRSVPHGAGMAFVVRDNGAGFDMRSADRLFGLFQRLHSTSDYPGTGVGLASVRRIVRRHGGEIWAESEAGRGAAFFFTLAA